MLRYWDALERWIIGILGAVALAIYIWQIVGRYISVKLAMPWGEELTVYIIIWAGLLTASQLVREDGHVRADLILRVLKVPTQRIIEIGNCVVAIVFCAALAWYGAYCTYDSYDIGERSMTSLAFPMWIYYLSLPTAATLMTIRYLARLYLYLFRFDPETMAVHSGRES